MIENLSIHVCFLGDQYYKFSTLIFTSRVLEKLWYEGFDQQRTYKILVCNNKKKRKDNKNSSWSNKENDFENSIKKVTMKT